MSSSIFAACARNAEQQPGENLAAYKRQSNFAVDGERRCAVHARSKFKRFELFACKRSLNRANDERQSRDEGSQIDRPRREDD